MKISKTVFIILTVSALLLLLCACDKAASDAVPTQAPETPEVTQEPTPTPAPAPSDSPSPSPTPTPKEKAELISDVYNDPAGTQMIPAADYSVPTAAPQSGSAPTHTQAPQNPAPAPQNSTPDSYETPIF